MARKPKYRRQREGSCRDRAFVELDGHRFYLGEYGTKESRAEYRRLVAEWLGGGGRLPVPKDGITVVEVLEKFWEHVQVYYRRPDGSSTSEVANYKSCLRLLKNLYGHTPACEFGPRALKTVRSHLQHFVHERRVFHVAHVSDARYFDCPDVGDALVVNARCGTIVRQVPLANDYQGWRGDLFQT